VPAARNAVSGFEIQTLNCDCEVACVFCCEFQIPFTPVIPVILNWHELNWHALMNLNMTGSYPDPDP
jgi:hypothetical protein